MPKRSRAPGHRRSSQRPRSVYAFAALFTGSHVVVMQFDAEEALALVKRRRMNWDLSQFRAMMRRRAFCRSIPARRLLLAGGFSVAALPWLEQASDQLGYQVILVYGGTEGQVATFIDGTEWLAPPRDSVGRPLYQGEIRSAIPDRPPRRPAGNQHGAGVRQEYGHPEVLFPTSAPPRPARTPTGGRPWATWAGYDKDGYLHLTVRDTGH